MILRLDTLTLRKAALFIAALCITLAGLSVLLVQGRFGMKSSGHALSSLTAGQQCTFQNNVDVAGQNDQVLFVGCAGFF